MNIKNVFLYKYFKTTKKINFLKNWLFTTNHKEIKILYFKLRYFLRIGLSLFYNYILLPKPVFFYIFTGISPQIIILLHVWSFGILFFLLFTLFLLIPLNSLRFYFVISKCFFLLLRGFFEEYMSLGFFFIVSFFLVLVLFKYLICSIFNVNSIIKNYFKLSTFFVGQFFIIRFLIFIENLNLSFLTFIIFFFLLFFDLNLFSRPTFCRPLDEDEQVFLNIMDSQQKFYLNRSIELFHLRELIYPLVRKDNSITNVIKENRKLIHNIEVLYQKGGLNKDSLTEKGMVKKKITLNYEQLFENTLNLRKDTGNGTIIDLVEKNHILYTSITLPSILSLKKRDLFFDLDAARISYIQDAATRKRLQLVKTHLNTNPERFSKYKLSLERAMESYQYLDQIKLNIEKANDISEEGEYRDRAHHAQIQIAGMLGPAKEYVSKFNDVGIVKESETSSRIKKITNDYHFNSNLTRREEYKLFNKETTEVLKEVQIKLNTELIILNEQNLNFLKIGMDSQINQNYNFIKKIKRKKRVVEYIINNRLNVNVANDLDIFNLPNNIFEKNNYSFVNFQNFNIGVYDEIGISKRNRVEVRTQQNLLINQLVDLYNIKGKKLILNFVKNKVIFDEILINDKDLKTATFNFQKNFQKFIDIKKNYVTADVLENFRNEQFKALKACTKCVYMLTQIDKKNNRSLLDSLENINKNFLSLKFEAPKVVVQKPRLADFLLRTAIRTNIIAFKRQDVEFQLQLNFLFKNEKNALNNILKQFLNEENELQKHLKKQIEMSNPVLCSLKNIVLEQLTPLQITQIKVFENIKFVLEDLKVQLNNGLISEQDRKEVMERYTLAENNLKKLESRIGILRHPIFIGKLHLNLYNDSLTQQSLNLPKQYHSFFEQIIFNSRLCNQYISDITCYQKEITELEYRINLFEEKGPSRPLDLEKKLRNLKEIHAVSQKNYKNKVLELFNLFENRPAELSQLEPEVILKNNDLRFEKDIRIDIEQKIEQYHLMRHGYKSVPNSRVFKFNNQFLEERIDGLYFLYLATLENILKKNVVLSEREQKQVKLEEKKIIIIRRELNIALDKLKRIKGHSPNLVIRTPIKVFDVKPLDISPIGVPAMTGDQYLKTLEHLRNPLLVLRRDPEKVLSSPILTSFTDFPEEARRIITPILNSLREDKKLSQNEYTRTYPQFYHVAGYASQVYYNAIINVLIKVDARLVTNELNVQQSFISSEVLDVERIKQCAIRNGINLNLLIEAVSYRQKANCPTSFIYENLDNIRIALNNQPFLKLTLAETIKKMLEGEGGGGAPPVNVAPRAVDLRILTKIRTTCSFFIILKTVILPVWSWFMR